MQVAVPQMPFRTRNISAEGVGDTDDVLIVGIVAKVFHGVEQYRESHREMEPVEHVLRCVVLSGGPLREVIGPVG